MTNDDADTEARRRAAETRLKLAAATDAEFELLLRHSHSTDLPDDVVTLLERLGFTPVAAAWGQDGPDYRLTWHMPEPPGEHLRNIADKQPERGSGPTP